MPKTYNICIFLQGYLPLQEQTCKCVWWLIPCSGKRAFSELNSLNLYYIVTFISELFMLNIHVTFLHTNIKVDFIKLDI